MISLGIIFQTQTIIPDNHSEKLIFGCCLHFIFIDLMFWRLENMALFFAQRRDKPELKDKD